MKVRTLILVTLLGTSALALAAPAASAVTCAGYSQTHNGKTMCIGATQYGGVLDWCVGWYAESSGECTGAIV